MKDGKAIRALTLYPDGRVFVPLVPLPGEASLFVIDLRTCFLSLAEISGHSLATTCCLAMGPRLITRCQELDVHRTVKIWGTSSYVRHEQGCLELLSEGYARPECYRTLF